MLEHLSMGVFHWSCCWPFSNESYLCLHGRSFQGDTCQLTLPLIGYLPSGLTRMRVSFSTMIQRDWLAEPVFVMLANNFFTRYSCILFCPLLPLTIPRKSVDWTEYLYYFHLYMLWVWLCISMCVLCGAHDQNNVYCIYTLEWIDWSLTFWLLDIWILT